MGPKLSKVINRDFFNKVKRYNLKILIASLRANISLAQSMDK